MKPPKRKRLIKVAGQSAPLLRVEDKPKPPTYKDNPSKWWGDAIDRGALADAAQYLGEDLIGNYTATPSPQPDAAYDVRECGRSENIDVTTSTYDRTTTLTVEYSTINGSRLGAECRGHRYGFNGFHDWELTTIEHRVYPDEHIAHMTMRGDVRHQTLAGRERFVATFIRRGI
jgi:hypothetical protein